MRNITKYTVILWILALSVSAFAQAKSFKTIPDDGRNVVQFTSQATMEKIVGTTNQITGSVDVNPADLMATTVGSFEVDLASLQTGIAMRDGHMREKFLETAKFPKATFVLSKFVSSDKKVLTPGETAKVMAEGQFTIHGVSKLYLIPLIIYYDKNNASTEGRLNGSKGDLLMVSADFPVKLADHNIDRPEMLFMKIAAEEQVSVNVALSDQMPPPKPVEPAPAKK